MAIVSSPRTRRRFSVASRHAALRRDCVYPPARPSVLGSHASGVTSRFWLARRRPIPLFRPAAGVRSPPATRACRARPSVRPRKPRSWRDIFTIRLLYIDARMSDVTSCPIGQSTDTWARYRGRSNVGRQSSTSTTLIVMLTELDKGRRTAQSRAVAVTWYTV